MDPEKVYLDKNNEGYVICKRCGESKKVNASNFKKNQPVKITCVCKNTFYIQFEQRQHYRKEVNIAGLFERIYPDHREKGAIIVEDISAGGLRFSTTTNNFLNKNDLLRITFVLDDTQKSHIEVKAIVKHIRARYVGVEFQGLDPQTQKTIGFYLLR